MMKTTSHFMIFAYLGLSACGSVPRVAIDNFLKDQPPSGGFLIEPVDAGSLKKSTPLGSLVYVQNNRDLAKTPDARIQQACNSILLDKAEIQTEEKRSIPRSFDIDPKLDSGEALSKFVKGLKLTAEVTYHSDFKIDNLNYDYIRDIDLAALKSRYNQPECQNILNEKLPGYRTFILSGIARGDISGTVKLSTGFGGRLGGGIPSLGSDSLDSTPVEWKDTVFKIYQLQQ